MSFNFGRKVILPERPPLTDGQLKANAEKIKEIEQMMKSKESADIGLGELEFRASDFQSPFYGGQYTADFVREHAAKVANAKLRERLEAAPVVYGSDGAIGNKRDDDDLWTYRAVCKQPIVRDTAESLLGELWRAFPQPCTREQADLLNRARALLSRERGEREHDDGRCCEGGYFGQTHDCRKERP